MKETTKIVTVFETEDGRQFERRLDAMDHETQLKLKSKLERFAVDGPDTVPTDSPTLASPCYKWFKVDNLDQLELVRSTLAPFVAPILHISPYEFPEYVGYSYRFHRMVYVRDVIEFQTKQVEAYNKFMENFPELNDQKEE